MISSLSSYFQRLTTLLPAMRRGTTSTLSCYFDQPQTSSSLSTLSTHSFKQLDIDRGAVVQTRKLSRSTKPQVVTADSAESIDSDWLFFDTNLREEGFSNSAIAVLKEEFSAQMIDLNRPMSPQMREMYKKIFPRKLDLLLMNIERELSNELKSMFFKITTTPSKEDERIVADFESRYVNQIKMLGALGKADYLKWYIFQKNRQNVVEEQRKSFVQHLLSDTWERCRRGYPAGFSALPLLMEERVIGPDGEGMVDRLSSLGVEKVRDELATALVYGSHSHKPLISSKSLNRRLEMLRDLALEGHPPSQDLYGCYLLENHVGDFFGEKTLDRERRLSEFKTLIDRESGLNHYTTCFYAFNGSRQLDAQLPIEERISQLETRAHKNDTYAFSILLKAYKNNYLYQFSHSHPGICLNLTEQQRWEKICALRPINFELWNWHLQFDYLSGSIQPEVHGRLIEIPLSLEERHAWILENAFANLSTDRAAVKLLQEAKDGELSQYQTFKERFLALFKLGLKGSVVANEEICRLIEWYNHGADLPFEKIEIFEMLISLALTGCEDAQWGVAKTILQTSWRLHVNGVEGLNLDLAKYMHVLREIAWLCPNENLSLDIIKHCYAQSQPELETLIQLRDALRAGGRQK